MDSNAPIHGLFGGTFDPLHYGHIKPLREVRCHVGLASLTYLPSARPPHRAAPAASAAHRLAMVRAALAQEAHCTVDDVELQRRGRSYTIDTVGALQRRHPRRRYALIMGLDALLGLERWHRWRALLGCISIIAMTRRGWRRPAPLPHWWREQGDHAAGAAGAIRMVEVTPVDISATEVRAQLAAGADIRALLPPPVHDYIHTHHLYGC